MPGEGSKLNYRLIGFKFPPVAHAGKYKIEIASGNCVTEDSFNRHIIQTLLTKKNKNIVEVPSFGASYSWRFSYSVHDVVIYSPLHHFSTGIIPQVDTNVWRLRVLQTALKYKDDYVFLDGNVALYDMKGKPVWYLVYMGGLQGVGDLKLSGHNTITFFENNRAFEENYEGKVLWRGPNDGKVSGGPVWNIIIMNLLILIMVIIWFWEVNLTGNFLPQKIVSLTQMQVEKDIALLNLER